MKSHIPPGLLSPDGALAVDARLLEQLLDQAPDIVLFIKDRAGRYVLVNQSLVLRDGLRHKRELLGRRVDEVYRGEMGRVFAEQDATVMRTGRPIVERLELHWRRPHQSCWCLTTKLPLRDAAGEVVGLIGLSRDVRAPLPLADIPTGLAHTLGWLEQHYDEAVSPSSLARHAGLGPERFARAVKRIFGLTPSQLIVRTRLDAASRLLRESGRSIAEIAVACGFYDHSAFTRAFRSATGQTPSEFRAGAR